MASTIKLKNGSGAPLASDLVAGEPALDLTNKRLYTEDSGGTVIEVGTNPTEIQIDNINIDGNTISSTDTDGNIAITPDGTGEVDISKVDIDSGTIDNTVIGGTTTAAGSFTTVTADAATLEGVKNTAVLTLSSTTNDTSWTPESDFYGKIAFDSDDGSGGGETTKGTIRVSPNASTGINDAMYFSTHDSVALKDRIKISHGGDISFYEDTGATAKFFWDASAEVLGVGTASPTSDADLHIAPASGNAVIQLEGALAEYWRLIGATNDKFIIQNETEGNVFVIEDGKVGIGTNDPDAALTVVSSSVAEFRVGNIGPSNNSAIRISRNDTTVAAGNPLGYVEFGGNDSTSNIDTAFAYVGAEAEATHDPGDNATALIFGVTADGSATVGEKMRLSSDGYLGIGTDSPDSPLEISSSSFGTALKISTTAVQTAVDDIHGKLLFEGKNASGTIYTTGEIKTVCESSAGTRLSGMTFSTSGPGAGILNEKMRIDSSGNVSVTGEKFNLGGTSNNAVFNSNFSMHFNIDADNNGSEVFAWGHNGDNTSTSRLMTLDASGNLMVGTTDNTIYNSGAGGETGIVLRPNLSLDVTRSGGATLNLNRLDSDGEIIDLRKDGATVGSIASVGGNVGIGNGDTGIYFSASNDNIVPCNLSTSPPSNRDNAIDLGALTVRFDDIYATNGTIQTSDRNEKQDIEELSEAEQRVAVAAKGLLRKFRWKNKVADKGDDARIHFGIIAQDLQAAFEAEGLDAGRYAMFIHSTWTDEETGEERSRMGVRYSELLAFIIAAI